MDITSMIFLFLFLPLSLGIYYIVNDGVKEYVLFIISLLFYSLGSLQYLSVFIFFIFLTIIIGRLISANKNIIWKRGFLVAGIIINISFLCYYKYADHFFPIIRRIHDSVMDNVIIKTQVLPLGISFFTFKAISYLMDIYTKKVTLSQNPIHDALYLSFFAQIQSGPLTRYGDMNYIGAKDCYKEGTILFSDGVFRFLIGFNKKILIANILANITDEVFLTPLDNLSTLYAWLGALCYSLQLFFDFSGYSDMAIGISEMFGYRCTENFNFPYNTESVAKFWRRWHMSLGGWFKDYVYIPLGGSKSEQKYKVYFNLFVVWMLTGIWHGASWNFIIWGLGYFLLISFERVAKIPQRFKTAIGGIAYRIITLLFINFQWVIFRMVDLESGLRYIKRMIVWRSNSLADLRTNFLIKDWGGVYSGGDYFVIPYYPLDRKKITEKSVVIFGV